MKRPILLKPLNFLISSTASFASGPQLESWSGHETLQKLLQQLPVFQSPSQMSSLALAGLANRWRSRWHGQVHIQLSQWTTLRRSCSALQLCRSSWRSGGQNSGWLLGSGSWHYQWGSSTNVSWCLRVSQLNEERSTYNVGEDGGALMAIFPLENFHCCCRSNIYSNSS